MFRKINKVVITALMGACAAFGVSTTLAQEQVPRPIPRAPSNSLPIPTAPDIRPSSPTYTIQSESEKMIQALRRDVSDLKNRVDAMEKNMSKIIGNASFSCKTRTISVNGAGVQQDCFPYLCQPIDGRCAPQVCNSIDDCAAPTACYPDSKCAYVR